MPERYASGAPDYPDMLGSWNRHGLDQEQAPHETFVQITAGSDSTAVGASTILLHLINNSLVYQKLLYEIDEAVRRGKISYPVIKDSESHQLPYLQAVIKESFRIMPPVVTALYKEVPPEGDTIHGRFITGGTLIGAPIYGITRSKKVFGPDADLFRPERWLEAQGEQLTNMLPTAELVFYHGKWQCAGKVVAGLELNKVIEVCRNSEQTL